MIAKLSALLLVCLIVGDGLVKAQDGRVKLCGREFVRMVISSCGSSRLRRHAPELDQPHRGLYNSLMGHMSSERFLSTGSGELEQQAPEWMSERGPSAASTEPEAASESQEPWTQPEGTGEAEENGAFQRFRRDAGPAGLCCRSGCTMSELVQFC